MKRLILVLCVLVTSLVASPVSAQSLPLPEHPVLTVAAWTFFAAAQADAATTFKCQTTRQCVEVDPLYANLSPSASVAASLAIDSAVAILVSRVLGKHHPKVASVILFSLAGYRTQATIHTLNLPRR